MEVPGVIKGDYWFSVAVEVKRLSSKAGWREKRYAAECPQQQAAKFGWLMHRFSGGVQV
jgi:hypothetical protein